MKLTGILEKAFGNIYCLRGYAPFIDLANISQSDDSYQRPTVVGHQEDIVDFIDSGEYTFFPEVILGASFEALGFAGSASDVVSAMLDSGRSKQKIKAGKISLTLNVKESRRRYSMNALAVERLITACLDNLQHLSSTQLLKRIDGNHRLSAAKDAKTEAQEYRIPFSIVLFETNEELRRFGRVLFHMINFRAEPIGEEKNLELILDESDFSNERLLRNPFGTEYYVARILRQNVSEHTSLVGRVSRTALVHLVKYLLDQKVYKQDDGEVILNDLMLAFGFIEGQMLRDNLPLRLTIGDEDALVALVYYYLKKDENFPAFCSWLQKTLGGDIKPRERISFQSLIAMYDRIRRDKRNTIFVSMQFGSCGTEKNFKIIQEVVENLNKQHSFTPPLRVVRVDQIVTGQTFEINEQVISEVSGCGHLIADLTYCNSNVYHEVGLLMGRTLALTSRHEYGMTLILDENVSTENKMVKFNISSLQQLRFRENKELRDGLALRLKKFYGVES